MGDVTMIEIIDFDFEKILGLSSASWKLSLKNGSVQPPKKRRKLFSALAVDSLDYTEVNEQIANTFQPNRAEGAGSNNGSGSRNGDNDLAFPW